MPKIYLICANFTGGHILDVKLIGDGGKRVGASKLILSIFRFMIIQYVYCTIYIQTYELEQKEFFLNYFLLFMKEDFYTVIGYDINAYEF